MKIIIETITNVSEDDESKKGRHIAGRSPLEKDAPADARRVYLQLYIPADHVDFDSFKVGQELDI